MTRHLVACAALLLAACATVPGSAHRGNTAAVADYLKSKPDAAQERFEEGGCSGCTLLHYAAGNERDVVEVVQVLIEKGADPNAREPHGMTPLHAACASQNANVVRYLLGAGAAPSLNAQDAAGNTPLILAAATFRRSEGWIITPAGAAVAHSNDASGPSEALITALLDAGADLRKTTRMGNTALHIAAYKGHAGAVALLLRRGADPAALNADGLTAAQLAAAYKQGDVLKVLAAAAPQG